MNLRARNINADKVTLALSAAVFVGGLTGLYLALKGLSTILLLGWGLQAFSLLGIVVFLACAVAFGFLYLSMRWLLSKGLKVCWVGALLTGLGVLAFLKAGDLPGFITLEVAGALLLAGLASVKGMVVGGPEVSLRRSPLLFLAVVVAVLSVAFIALTYVLPNSLGYGGVPLLEGTKAYVPSGLGYREVGIERILKSVNINGSQLTLGLRVGPVVRGIVERVVEESVYVVTRLGHAVLNLPDLERHGISVRVISPPTPAITPSLSRGEVTSMAPHDMFREPPQVLFLVAKASSLMNMVLGKLSFINLVSLLFSFILVIYGLSLVGSDKHG